MEVDGLSVLRRYAPALPWSLFIRGMHVQSRAVKFGRIQQVDGGPAQFRSSGKASGQWVQREGFRQPSYAEGDSHGSFGRDRKSDRRFDR